MELAKRSRQSRKLVYQLTLPPQTGPKVLPKGAVEIEAPTTTTLEGLKPPSKSNQKKGAKKTSFWVALGTLKSTTNRPKEFQKRLQGMFRRSRRKELETRVVFGTP